MCKVTMHSPKRTYEKNVRAPLAQAVYQGTEGSEGNLVVQAARVYLAGGDDSGLQAALAQPLHWEAIELIADRHAIKPLVIYVLNQYGTEKIPQEVRDRFQQQWLLAARNNLIQMQEWRRLLQAFDAAGLPVISLKGPSLALQAYRNVVLREFTDLDLLVVPEDMPAASDLLVREGYRLQSSADRSTLRSSRNRQMDFINDDRGTVIDLHWSPLHAMFPFQLPVRELFQSARVEHREGISFLTLSPEHLLLYLCAHGTKHCWLNLRDLCDVACSVSAEGLDWEQCMAWAKSAHCGLVLKHALLLTQQVLGLKLPPQIQQHCEEEGEAQTLANTAAAFLFRKGNDIGYRETLHYHLAFVKGWHAQSSFLFERLFIPAEPDWQHVRLPQPLHFLYYLVRPVRLLLERLPRTS